MLLFEDPATTSKIPALERPAFAKVAAAAHPGDILTVSELFRLCRDLVDIHAPTGPSSTSAAHFAPPRNTANPANEEWREFQQHFHARKLELGDCARPYGTPCQHEHSCLRCPMLRVSPRQRGRLIEIIRNLNERIAEARMNGWLGEVQGLQVSFAKAKEKLAGLDRSIARAKDIQSPTTRR